MCSGNSHSIGHASVNLLWGDCRQRVAVLQLYQLTNSSFELFKFSRIIPICCFGLVAGRTLTVIQMRLDSGLRSLHPVQQLRNVNRYELAAWIFTEYSWIFVNTWIFLNIFFQIREYLWMFKEYFWHRKIERIFTNIFFDIFDKRIFTNIYGHLWINIDHIHKYLSIFMAWILLNIYWIFSEKVQWIFKNIHRCPRLSPLE